MSTATTKPVRRAVRKTAVTQHLSDRRYYVQCAYRIIMAIISLIALAIVTTNR